MSIRTATPTELYVPGVSSAIMWTVQVKSEEIKFSHRPDDGNVPTTPAALPLSPAVGHIGSG